MKSGILLISFLSFNLNGYIQSYWKAGMEGKVHISWIQHTFKLNLEENIKNQVYLKSEVDLDFLGFPGVVSFNDLLRSEKISPFRFYEREIYIEFPYLVGFLDVKMGEIIEKWGTADTFNPTDNINPYNLEDAIDFGESMPVPGISASATLLDTITLKALYLPIFRPAKLPLSAMKAGPEAFPLPEDAVNWMEIFPKFSDLISTIEKRPLLPTITLRNSAFAFKIAGTIFGIDLSLSYFQGREDMPVPFTAVIDFWEQSGVVYLVYPKIKAFGFDLATAIPGIDAGLWFEGCLFFPERVKESFRVDLLGEPLAFSFTRELLTSPYLKFTTGVDYTFPYGIYVNLQFIRGMFDEVGNEMIRNYIFAGIQDTLFADRVRYRIFFGFTLDDNSYVIYPEIAFLPYEEGEIAIGGLLLEGSRTSKFGQPAAGEDEVFLRFKAYY